MERPLCKIEGCQNLAKIDYHVYNHNNTRVKTLYKKRCRKHTDIYYGYEKNFGSKNRRKRKINNSKCEKCGWDEGYCHRHRIKEGQNGGLYIIGNVLSLCPNCHQLIHIKKPRV